MKTQINILGSSLNMAQVCFVAAIRDKTLMHTRIRTPSNCSAFSIQVSTYRSYVCGASLRNYGQGTFEAV
jgi:hypothetical protein